MSKATCACLLATIAALTLVVPAAAAAKPTAGSLNNEKVVMWSYPIIRDRLIYVVDLRNGLYVLKYTGE